MRIKDLNGFDMEVLNELEMDIVKGGWQKDSVPLREEKDKKVFYNEDLASHFSFAPTVRKYS